MPIPKRPPFAGTVRQFTSFVANSNEWVAVSALIPKPWPEEAVQIDLRFIDSFTYGRYDKRPGRPALCERWGLSEGVVRRIMLKHEASARGPSDVVTPKAAERRTPNYRRTVLNRDAIRLEDGTPSKVGKCARCGTAHPLAHLEADHIEPIAFGGENHPSNMQTLCRPCHKAKTASEFGRTR